VSLLLLALAVLSVQSYVVAESWIGIQAPDPIICLAAFAGLYWPRRTLLLAAIALGWGRALVLLEPAGGQILCAWLTLAVVASQRGDHARTSWVWFVTAALLAAATWSTAGVMVRLAFDVPLQAGLELFLGAVLSIPLAGLAQGTARVTGLASA
jgi:hypothetical protein